jgi:hypothetical protein
MTDKKYGCNIIDLLNDNKKKIQEQSESKPKQEIKPVIKPAIKPVIKPAIKPDIKPVVNKFGVFSNENIKIYLLIFVLYSILNTGFINSLFTKYLPFLMSGENIKSTFGNALAAIILIACYVLFNFFLVGP